MSDEKLDALGEQLSGLDKQIAAVQAQLDEARGTACEVYSRITGYYRAVQKWNIGKAQEFRERQSFNMPNKEQNEAIEQRRKPTCRMGNDRVCEYYSRGENNLCANEPCAKEALGKKGEQVSEASGSVPFNKAELEWAEAFVESAMSEGKRLADKERAANKMKGKPILSSEQVAELLNTIQEPANDTCESCKISNSKIENTPVYHGEQEPKATTIDDWGVLNEQKPTKWTKYKDLAKDFYAELYTKKTCLNCPAVVAWLEGAPFDIRRIDADSEAGLKQASENGVFSTPTVIFKKGDKELGRAHSVNDLRGIFKGVTE